MNSRGKPLTEFENFKAHFEQTQLPSPDAPTSSRTRSTASGRTSCGPTAATTTSSTTSSCATSTSSPRSASGARAGSAAMKSSRPSSGSADLLASATRAVRSTSTSSSRRSTSGSEGHRSPTYFAELFTTSADGTGVRLFGAPSTEPVPRLLRDGTARRARHDAAVLADRHAAPVRRPDPSDPRHRRRLALGCGSLRNVNEASQFEMRVQNMPKLIADVASVHAERRPRRSGHLQPEPGGRRAR